jgi:lysophospholipase
MQLVTIARNPAPSGAVVGQFKGYDGAPLRFARWQPTRGPRRGTVVCLPGRGEIIEAYFETIADLTRRGFAVAVMDFRGQGGSVRELDDPRKGHITDFSAYDRDLACFMREVVMPDCTPPYIGLGHSMGGNVLIRNAALAGTWFDRLVVTAPMLRLHPSKVANAYTAARIYARVGTLAGLGTSYVRGGSAEPDAAVTFETNELTGDRDRWLRNRTLQAAAAELGIGSPTVAWLDAAFRSCAALMVPDFAKRISVPMLLVSSGRDTIVSSHAIETFAGRLKLATHIGLSTSMHEILQESDALRGRFWATFDAYMGLQAEAA